MKKSVKITFLTALSLVITGVLIFVITMSCLGWDFTKLNTKKHERNEYTIVQAFDKISLNTGTADVTVMPSDDGSCRVECREFEGRKHIVKMDGDTLVIQGVDERKWYDYIGIAFGSEEIIVYLPEIVVDEIILTVATGDVTIASGVDVKKATITSSTGKISVQGHTMDELKLQGGTGDVVISDVAAQNVTLSVSTGKIILNRLSLGDITIAQGSGSVCAAQVSVSGSFSVKTGTGDVAMEGVVVVGNMSIEGGTGNVGMYRCDAGEIYVQVSTGSLSGSLLTGKIFDARSNTGSVDVPASVGGGLCTVRLGTGSVHLTIVE